MCGHARYPNDSDHLRTGSDKMASPDDITLASLIQHLMDDERVYPASVAKHGGIHRNTLRKILEGTTQHPDVGTLRGIAQGIASHPRTGATDDQKSARFFHQLCRVVFYGDEQALLPIERTVKTLGAVFFDSAKAQAWE